MTKKLDLYKCNVCGNLVEVVLEGEGELVCCSQPMEHVKPHSPNEEMLGEKHVPVISVTENETEIRVGSIPHPMEDKHYIQFIEAYSPDKNYVKRKYLYPNEKPLLKFKCHCAKVVARELCNIHGLWESPQED